MSKIIKINEYPLKKIQINNNSLVKFTNKIYDTAIISDKLVKKYPGLNLQ